MRRAGESAADLPESARLRRTLGRLKSAAFRLSIACLDPLQRYVSFVLLSFLKFLANRSQPVIKMVVENGERWVERGNYRVALLFFDIAYGAVRSRFGAQDLRTALLARKLGQLLAFLGELPRAFELHALQLNYFRNLPVIDEEELLQSEISFAQAQFLSGDHPAGCESFRRIYEHQHEIHGPMHPGTLQAATFLASAMMETGDVHRARDLAGPTLSRLREIGVTDGTELLATYVYGSTLQLLGDSTRAATVLREVSTAKRPEDRFLQICQFKATASLCHILEPQEARQVARDLLRSSLSDVLMQMHPQEVIYYDLAANAYTVFFVLGDLETALEIAQDAYTRSRAHAVGKTLMGQRITLMLAFAHIGRGDWKAAARLLQEAHSEPIENETVRLQAMSLLADSYRHTGNPAAAFATEAGLGRAFTVANTWNYLYFVLAFDLLRQWVLDLKELPEAVEATNTERREVLQTLGLRLIEEIELCDTVERQRLHELKSPDWRLAWLILCATQPFSSRLPLSLLYGTESWSIALEAATASASENAAGPVPEYLRLRSTLTKLRFELDKISEHTFSLSTAAPGTRAITPISSSGATTALEEEQRLVSQLKQLRGQIDAQDPLMAAFSAAKRLTGGELRAQLQPGEGVLMLFLNEYGLHTLVEVAGKEATLSPEFEGIRALSQGAEESADDRTITSTAFWRLLNRDLPNVSRWHCITSTGLHTVFVDAQRPPALSAYYYCGLPAYVRLRAQPPQRPSPPARIDVYIDTAENTSAPIPFARIESELLQAVATLHNPGPDSRVVPHPAARLADLTAGAPHLQIICHGVLGRVNVSVQSVEAGSEDDTAGENLHGMLGLDIAAGVFLTPAKVLALPGAIDEVFISACVGGYVGDTVHGDPLGLVSAFQLRGTRVVVAFVAPISDFFAPLLTALYWYARYGGAEPFAALQLAKHRLRTAQFPEDFISCARTLYIEQMMLVLERAAVPLRGPPTRATLTAAKSIGSWPLPESVRKRYFDGPPLLFEACGHRSFSHRWCTSAERRHQLCESIADTLFATASPSDRSPSNEHPSSSQPSNATAWPARTARDIEVLCQAAVLFGSPDRLAQPAGLA